MSVSDNIKSYVEEWSEWQTDVVNLVRRQFCELLPNIRGDDFDWDAWRSYFVEGYLPRDAVRLALSPVPYRGESFDNGRLTIEGVHFVHMEID